MTTVEYNRLKFETDEDGFLYDLSHWNETWVQYVKEAESIKEITDDHRRIIQILQEYYKQYAVAPRMSALIKNSGFKLKYIYELFPSGPGKGACRMAGLPKPTGCV
jgi:dissimilatory sulfite reductase related protein